MSLIRILEASPGCAGIETDRLWMELGQPMLIAPNLAMTASMDCIDGEHVPAVHFVGKGADHRFDLPAGCWLNAEDWTGYRISPRAVEYSASGRPLRLLLGLSAAQTAAAVH